MANRRYGGGGGGGGSGGSPQKFGNYHHQQNFQGNKVNPWQGGAGPNSAMNSGSLLSQLSGPQAQLALALSSLLQTQPSMNNPPSLLSLPTTNPAFGNQDNFGSSQSRFGNHRGRDFRRHEPYNKHNRNSGGGGGGLNNAAWRDSSTRPSGNYGGGGGNRSLSSSGNRGRLGFGGGSGGKDRKSPGSKNRLNRNNSSGANKNQVASGGGGGGNRPNTNKTAAAFVSPAATKTSVDKTVTTGGSSAGGGGGGGGGGNNDDDESSSLPFKTEPPSQMDESVDITNSDEGRDEEIKEEKKRDWKEEKNMEVKEEMEEPTEEAVDLTMDEEMNNVTPNTSTEHDRDKRESKKPRDGKYHGVPASLLHCFVCNKSMWDGESFQNHVRGKAHKQIMDSLGQSFQITVNILRENMRLFEEKKMIEMERVYRNSRNFHRQMQEPQSHCNMCDLKFRGMIIIHRKTEGHQRLKRFLHPKCGYCVQEFPSRMEWVDHRFTPEHLRKVKEVLESRVGDEDGAPLEEESPDLENDPLLEESLQTEDQNPILELSDDLKDLQNRIPAYKPTRAVAEENVQPVSGFYCDLCLRFMTTEAAAKEHAKTERHYELFVEAAKRQYKRMTDKEKAAASEKRRKSEGGEAADDLSQKKIKCEEAEAADLYDPEEACKENTEGGLVDGNLEEEMAEVEALMKTAEAEEKQAMAKEEIKVEEDELQPDADSVPPAVVTSTPVVLTLLDKKPEITVTPTGRGRRIGTSNVRNGAGPRSKTRRGGR